MSTETRTRWTGWLQITALVFACVTGAFSVGAIIFKGGWLVRTVEIHDVTLIRHDSRLAKIESDGSPKIASHEKLDDERDARNRERIAAVESAVKEVTKMAESIGRMSQKIDDLKEQLQKRP